MVSRCTTIAFQGITAVPVDVQVMVGPGKMSMQIVGLADKAVAESRERVQSALHASGLSMPTKRVTVNLAPADLPKEGSHYDLPIALALMCALGALPGDALERYLVMGELGLDGTIAQVAGALPAAIGANALDKGLICPSGCGAEAAWADKDMDILAPRSLIAMANHFKGTQVLTRPVAALRSNPKSGVDMADIRGQETAKRALEIAAAGGHNLVIVYTIKFALPHAFLDQVRVYLIAPRYLRNRKTFNPRLCANLPLLAIRPNPHFALAHRAPLSVHYRWWTLSQAQSYASNRGHHRLR